MAEHTPGPWRVNADLHEIDNVVPTLPFDASRRRVATIHGYDAEYEANARLIAAAPSMLTALRRAYDALVAQNAGEYVDLSDEYIAIATVIANAEGRTS